MVHLLHRLYGVDAPVCLSVRHSVTLVNCDYIGWNSTTSPSPQMGVPYAPTIREWPSLQRVIRSTSCLVLGWGFRGRRI